MLPLYLTLTFPLPSIFKQLLLVFSVKSLTREKYLRKLSLQQLLKQTGKTIQSDRIIYEIFSFYEYLKSHCSLLKQFHLTIQGLFFYA